jgi:hypothetical protein
MRRHPLWAALFLLLVVPAAPAQVKFEWKWKEGDTFFLETTTHLKQTLALLGPKKDDLKQTEVKQQIKQDVEQTVVLSYTVKKKNPDGGVELAQKIEGVRLKTPVGVTSTDTALQGVEVTLLVNAKGEVTDIKGHEALVEKILGVEKNTPLGKTLQAVLSKDALVQTATAGFGFLPQQSVKPEEKWTRKQTVARGPLGQLALEETLTYDRDDKLDGKTVAKISTTTKVTELTPRPQAEGTPQLFQVLEGKFDRDTAHGSGTILFDAEAGRLVSAESSMKLEGTFKIQTSGEVIDTRLSQEETTKARVLDKNPITK